MIGRNYPSLELLTQRPIGVGKVFWVDGTSGVADAEGTDPNHPLETITEALDHCTTRKGDAIIVLQNSPSAPPTNETFPIDIDKAGVLLAGLYSRGIMSDSGFGSDEQNVACLSINADYVTVEGLYLGIDNLGSNGGVIEGAKSCFAFTLRQCMIEAQYAATYGFYTGATWDFPYLLIEDCIFGSGQGSKFSANAIRLFNASMNSIIRRNLFRHSTAAAIKCLASCGGVGILDNRFQVNSNLAGGAITLDDGSSRIFVDGNHAGFGMTSMNNPYLDSNGDNSNDWGTNWDQEAATLPG